MRRGSTLPFLLLVGGLPACAATTSRGDVAAAELAARSARDEATREHARLVEMEGRIVELERRLASKNRACEATPAPLSVDVARAREQPMTDPRRSQGDFLAEARVATPATAAAQAGPQVSEREHMQQLLEGMREYAFDRQSGLSTERREALRVLLQRERQLDLMNPWESP